MQYADGRLNPGQEFRVGVDVKPGRPVLGAWSQLAHACMPKKPQRSIGFRGLRVLLSIST